ncbi:hypothetical protein [Pseudarthrobacter enclensis]|uniref:Uncharacterized protein n=1 Tax=Pseudarthrobacter enclensis TaxID=993070 RepID=A0ABT9RWG7_9MICC|nr:hypothetical protein [Pseudarthrobacter enclensis]MDP9889597.1 hypothetical protein [Pseudarthrobacter enclensis]
MNIQQWWPKLHPSTQQWLVDNNGDVVPHGIILEIIGAGGPPMGDPWWDESDEAGGVVLPDEAIDWIEATANDEDPT